MSRSYLDELYDHLVNNQMPKGLLVKTLFKLSSDSPEKRYIKKETHIISLIIKLNTLFKEL